jgi:putative FmdB family regulatory protein
MPIYEYRCTSCGRTTEVIQKMNDAPLTTCSECSGKLEKLISRSAFLLKGGGWYSEGYGGSSGSGSGSSSGSGSGTPASSDKPSKPKGSGDGSGDSSGTTKKAAAGGGCGSGTCGCH